MNTDFVGGFFCGAAVIAAVAVLVLNAIRRDLKKIMDSFK